MFQDHSLLELHALAQEIRRKLDSLELSKDTKKQLERQLQAVETEIDER